MLNPIYLSVLLGQVYGGVVHIRRTSTIPDVTLTTTVQPDAKIISATTTTEVTIFQAVTTPLTIASGTIYTTIGTTKPAPVTQQSSYSHTSVSKTIDPSVYTTGTTIGTPQSSATSSSEAVISSSSEAATSKSTSEATTAAISTGDNNGADVPTATIATAAGSSSSSSSSNVVSSAVSSSGSMTTSSSPASSAVSSTSSSTPVSSSSSTTSNTASSGGNYYSDMSDIFSPVDTADPLSMFPRKGNGLSVPDNLNVKGPIQTNKFYANLFLGSQEQTVFAQPYELFKSTDTTYYGMGVSYVEWSQRVFAKGDPAEYYTNPLKLMSFVYSAKEFSSSNFQLSVTDSEALFTTAELTQGNNKITLPIAIGMGMTTAIYNGDITPVLFSQLGINTLIKGTSPHPGVQKYKAVLFNSKIWNIYVSTSDDDFELKINSNYKIEGSKAIDGLVIQLAVLPDGATDDTPLDEAAGIYTSGTSISGSVSNDVATYSLNYNTKGSSKSGSGLLYALPHHVDAFSAETKAAAKNLTAYSPTKGHLTGVLANKLVMEEKLYTDLQWLPYQVDNQNTGKYSGEELQLLAKVLNSEISEDMVGQTNSASTYTAGKGFDKFAYIILVASEILGDDATTKQGLESLKSALSPWLSNKQLTPFIYDTNWKGVTSSATEDQDFGAPWYNDHHFHYGYYVHTAAVIGMLDKKYGGSWAEDNKAWVNNLVRDVANPSTDDTHFPVFRMFDFFNGHSWAAGLWESGDGKNEESTSEDINFAYGMKLWGQVIGDKEMESRGDLMLAIMKRSMDKYFYFKNDNTIQPSRIIGNRVPGITYENKLDHTTFFGTNIEYIQGIQMLPITGASGLIRSKEFVEQEWNSLLKDVAPTLNSGWAGVLRSNQALFDPNTSYEYFAQDGFQSEWLDGGASRTWYLALAAGLKGDA